MEIDYAFPAQRHRGRRHDAKVPLFDLADEQQRRVIVPAGANGPESGAVEAPLEVAIASTVQQADQMPGSELGSFAK